jgi:hypothetical protein
VASIVDFNGYGAWLRFDCDGHCEWGMQLRRWELLIAASAFQHLQAANPTTSADVSKS